MIKKALDSLKKNELFDIKILKNTFWLSSADVINKGLLLLITILIARKVGATQYGILSFAFAFTGVFIVLADFGLSTLITKKIAGKEEKMNHYIQNVVLLKYFLAIVTLVVAVIIIWFWKAEPLITKLVTVLTLYVILNSFSEFFRSLFRGKEIMHYDFLSKSLQGIVLLISAGVILLIGGNILVFSYSFLFSSLIGLIIMIKITKSKMPQTKIGFKRPNISSWEEIIKESWPFAFSIVFVSIYFSVDSILINEFLGATQVGYYAASYTLATGLYFIPAALANAYFPRFSYAFNKDPKSLRRLLRKILIKSTIIIIPLFIFINVFSSLIIRLLYGSEYTPSIIILNALTFAIIFKFYSYPYGYLLSSTNNQKSRLFAQISTATFNIVTNIIFIPMLGILGAALTTIASEALLMGMYAYSSHKELRNLDLSNKSPIKNRKINDQ